MSLTGAQPLESQYAALIKLVHRAVNYARSNGVTPIAALGNLSLDISDGNTMRNTIVVPAEISGVIAFGHSYST